MACGGARPTNQPAMHVTGAISPPQAREEEEKAVEQIRDMGGSNYDTMISGRAYGVWRSPANQPTSHACGVPLALELREEKARGCESSLA